MTPGPRSQCHPPRGSRAGLGGERLDYSAGDRIVSILQEPQIGGRAPPRRAEVFAGDGVLVAEPRPPCRGVWIDQQAEQQERLAGRDGDAGELRVSVIERDGERRLDIRYFSKTERYSGPTKKGISLSAEEFDVLKSQEKKIIKLLTP